jgi:hypothetical protein
VGISSGRGSPAILLGCAMTDEHIHCFARGHKAEFNALFTLCGRQYYPGTLSLWPQRFVLFIKEARDDFEPCPHCENHPDLELKVLAEA